MTAEELPPRPGAFRRRLLHNAAATAAANGWTMVLALGSLPFVLHGLGATAFGVWALLQTFSAITGWLSLADLGVGLAATRHVADHASRDEIDERDLGMGTALALCTAIGAGFALLLIAIGPRVFPSAFNVPHELQSALRFATVVFGVQVLFELVASGAGSCLDGLQRIDLSRLADAARRTAVAFATALTALAGGGLRGVAVASASATTVGALFAVLLLWRQTGRLPLRFSGAIAGQLLRYGRTVWALSSTGVLHRTMDRLVVGVVLGPGAVTLVEIANQVQNGVGATLGATSYTITSGAAWIHGRDTRDRLRDLVIRSSKYCCLVTLPLCGLVALLAGPIVQTWLGHGFPQAADLVRLALLYLATQAPLAAATNALIGVGKAGRIVRPALIAVAVNLTASILLVEWFGVAGSFVATLVSSLVLSPMLLHLVATDLDVSPRDLFAEAIGPALLPTAAGAVVAGAALLTPLPSPAVAAIGGIGGLAVAIAVVLRVTLHQDERTEFVRGFSR